MRELIGVALRLGWDLHAYEVDSIPHELEAGSVAAVNWRDDRHARNLLAILTSIGAETPLFVWCGNGHLTKHEVGEHRPMAFRLTQLSGINPFSIDQTQGVVFEEGRRPDAARWVHEYSAELAARGGAAGFLAEDAPTGWAHAGADAYVFLLENGLS